MEKYAPVIAAKAYFATVKQLLYNTFGLTKNSSKGRCKTD
jgi:hypothetical protein